MFGGGCSAKDGLATFAGLGVAVGSAEESEELVEAAFGGDVRLIITQMPLADERRGVACAFERLWERHLIQRQAEIGRGGFAGIELMSEALLIASGHQTRARWGADRAAHVAVGEAHAVFCDRVDVWGLHIL